MHTMDSLHRFIFENKAVRGELIQLQSSFQAILDQHAYPPPIRKLLGEALCVAGLLCAIIKFEGRLSVQFRGEGKLKFLLAQCDNDFNLRGLAKWEDDLSYEELMKSFTKGILVIILDSGASHKRYQGIVAWQGNSLAESVEGYFRNSEQLQTKIWLAVDEKSAAGFLLQVIPPKSKEFIEENVLSKAEWLQIANQNINIDQEHLLLSQEPENLLKTLYPEESIRLFPPVDVQFKCTCSRKKGEEAILILGQTEAEAELADRQSIVVTCDFCNQAYLFDKIDVSQIFEHNNIPPGKTLH